MHEVSIFTKGASEETIGNAIAFDKTDRSLLREIYEKWYELNTQIALLKGRRIMFPMELLEAIICMQHDMWKVTNSMSRRYDLWDPNADEDKNRILVQVTSNAVFQTFVSERLIEEIDRLFFVKLFISKGEPLRYEIFDFDVRSFAEEEISVVPGRRIIKYDDLKSIPYNNIYKGEL